MQVSQILGYEDLDYVGHLGDPEHPTGKRSVYERRGAQHITPDQRAKLQGLAKEYDRTVEVRMSGLTTEVIHPG
jgi:hypothetical protein